MRSSQYYICTLKEAPADAEVISHKLMLRAGLIKRLSVGVYTWMPLGLRVLRKVEAIIREEMNRAGAMELLMPAVQPAELWQESGRWEKYGPDLLRFRDRYQRELVIGPTHEEVVTDAVRRDIKSYRQLPVHLYQIQSKFRDEIRPRFGVMRGREFIMKDGYSFHADYADLEREYNKMHQVYCRIFNYLGLQFRAVAADTGSIGGADSQEFHVVAETGEDSIAWCPDSDYAANVELAQALAPYMQRPAATEEMQRVATPDKTTCAAVAEMLSLPLQTTVKQIIVSMEGAPEAGNARLVALLLRGDHNLNEIKLQKLIGGYRFASHEEIQAALGCVPGYVGPVGVADKGIEIIADHSVVVMHDFVCGANEAGYHLRGVNFVRDLPEPDQIADIRNVISGDPSPDGKGYLSICRGIEVGHIFQLRTKYSRQLGCEFLDPQGKSQPMEMGCYGIGVTRVVAAAIEQGHDERGIIFPAAIAPFAVIITPVGYHNNETVRTVADQLYSRCLEAEIDVLLDDRDERPGVIFADADLIGVPHRIVVGARALANGELEYKGRQEGSESILPVADALAFLQAKLSATICAN